MLLDTTNVKIGNGSLGLVGIRANEQSAKIEPIGLTIY